jgi:protein-S-isoprenylcysteine O-methyltransferase Ste14
VHLAFDICQGIGIAAAVGIRPFIPALAVGALAAGDVQIDFKGTDYAFLERAPFLLAMLVCAFLLALVERPRASGGPSGAPAAIVVGVAALVIGALLFAAALAQDHYAAWPGYIAGAVCAAVGIGATLPLLTRVRARLDPSAASAVPLYAEAAALALAVLAVLAPPVGAIGFVLLVWLLLAGRRREGQKYAGLRILR